eukprot:15158892-Alexandrium_andersonii.AAC.1
MASPAFPRPGSIPPSPEYEWSPMSSPTSIAGDVLNSPTDTEDSSGVPTVAAPTPNAEAPLPLAWPPPAPPP